jgi:acyl carrier protein
MATLQTELTNQPSSAIKDQIREFVRENLASAKGIGNFTDEESLTENGIIDSLGIFRLVSFLEDTFGVRLGDEEITAENLRSIDIIEQFVVSKTSK